MILYICAVYDRAVQTYNRPIFVPHTGMALRGFVDEVNRIAPDNTMNAHPDDFELFLLGRFDDTKGAFDPQPPECIVRAKDVVKKGE